MALCTDTGPLVWPVNYSMVEDDIEIWKELFGPRFKVKEEEA